MRTIGTWKGGRRWKSSSRSSSSGSCCMYPVRRHIGLPMSFRMCASGSASGCRVVMWIDTYAAMAIRSICTVPAMKTAAGKRRPLLDPPRLLGGCKMYEARRMYDIPLASVLPKGDFAPLVESPTGAVWRARSQPSRTTAPLRDATSARSGGCEPPHPKDGWGPPQLRKDKDAR